MKTVNKKALAVGILVLAIGTSANGMTFQSVKTMYYETQRFLSAIKVQVKQASISLHQKSETIRKSRSIKSVADQAVQSTEATKKVIIDYSPEFGQPVTAKCLAIAEKASTVSATKSSEKIQADLMKSYSSATTETLASDSEERLEAHNAMFCNSQEANVGACKIAVNGMEGWDSNYGNFVSNSTLPSEKVAGALAYVNTMAEPPPSELIHCKSAACTQARALYLSSAAQSSGVTKTLLNQVSNRLNKKGREAFEGEL